jgi:mono/diheme cytochrome c family protein
MARAEWLLRYRLPCQGCHEIGGTGGRIGPSLSGLSERRSRDEVLNMIRDPQRAVPGTVMPRVPMGETTRQLIASYLVQRKAAATEPAPAVRAAAPVPRTSSHGDAAVLYRRFCAPCHGVRGKGDGYNARFLPVRPTAHADSSYMSKRSDEDLFDTIAGGGEFVDRSNLMPAFGRTLTRDEIRGIVHYLRSLCRCEAPGWARAD